MKSAITLPPAARGATPGVDPTPPRRRAAIFRGIDACTYRHILWHDSCGRLKAEVENVSGARGLPLPTAAGGAPARTAGRKARQPDSKEHPICPQTALRLLGPTV